LFVISIFRFYRLNYEVTEEIKLIYPPEMYTRKETSPGFIFYIYMLPVIITRFGEGFYIGKKLNNQTILGLMLLFVLLGLFMFFKAIPESLLIVIKWIISILGIMYATRCFMSDTKYRIRKIRKSISNYSLMRFNVALGIQATIAYFFITMTNVSFILIGAYIVGLYKGIVNDKA